ncbi:hypothetical protein [Sphingopyxis sp.]|uniref:hypothetical protein n=1 Tax=Sphingopyxis sp. TaxID=1908224 RepID=UPI003D143330
MMTKYPKTARQRVVVAIIAALFLIPSSQASDPGDTLEYVSEYGVMIGPEDRVSSTGAKLSKPAAILQQDRFNVNVRGILQPGDSVDSYFTSNAHRAQIAKALIEFGDDQARAHLINGTYPLLILAQRRMGDERLILFISTSDGEPADDSAPE